MIAFHLFLSACIGLLLEFATGIALGQTVNRSQPISIEQIENACQQVQQRIQSVQVSYKYRQSSTPAFDALVKSAGNNVIVAKVIESRTWAEKGKKFYLPKSHKMECQKRISKFMTGKGFISLKSKVRDSRSMTRSLIVMYCLVRPLHVPIALLEIGWPTHYTRKTAVFLPCCPIP